MRTLARQLRILMVGVPRALSVVWRAHRGRTVALALLSVVFGLSPALTAWVNKLLIDSIVLAIQEPGRPEIIEAVIKLIILQFGLIVGGMLLHTAHSLNLQVLQELSVRYVQLMLMKQSVRLDLSFFENPTFYDTLQQAEREAIYRPTAMVEQMFRLLHSLITFLSMVALTASLGWVVVLAALIAPIPSFIASSRYGWLGFMMSRRQSPDRRRMGYLSDLLTKDIYHKEIRLFNLGDYLIKRWEEVAARSFRESHALTKRRSLTGVAWGSLSTLVSSCTYLYVALKTMAGTLTLGDLALYTQVVQSVQSSLTSILDGISQLYESSLYLNGLFGFLEAQPTIRDAPDALPLKLPLRYGIEFRNVTFAYPNRAKPAIRDVSFHIRPGEAVALVGHNGAGKSTIVKLLARLYDPSDGQILIDGVDIRQYSLESLHSAIGIIFQDYITYFFSARDNIGVGQIGEIGNLELVRDSAVQSGAAHMIERLPKQYDTMLGNWFDEGYQLSGGEWQKIALARAFMRDAAILVLDEPTASLDARAEYEIFTSMKQLMKGKVVIFSSHRFSTVRLADRIFVIEDGTIKEAGNHEELLAVDGTYAELFNLQAAGYK